MQYILWNVFGIFCVCSVISLSHGKKETDTTSTEAPVTTTTSPVNSTVTSSSDTTQGTSTTQGNVNDKLEISTTLTRLSSSISTILSSMSTTHSKTGTFHTAPGGSEQSSVASTSNESPAASTVSVKQSGHGQPIGIYISVPLSMCCLILIGTFLICIWRRKTRGIRHQQTKASEHVYNNYVEETHSGTTHTRAAKRTNRASKGPRAVNQQERGHVGSVTYADDSTIQLENMYHTISDEFEIKAEDANEYHTIDPIGMVPVQMKDSGKLKPYFNKIGLMHNTILDHSMLKNDTNGHDSTGMSGAYNVAGCHDTYSHKQTNRVIESHQNRWIPFDDGYSHIAKGNEHVIETSTYTDKGGKFNTANPVRTQGIDCISPGDECEYNHLHQGENNASGTLITPTVRTTGKVQDDYADEYDHLKAALDVDKTKCVQIPDQDHANANVYFILEPNSKVE